LVQVEQMPAARAAGTFGVGALAFPALLVRSVHVELNGKPVGDELLLGKGARQFDPVLCCQLAIRRRRQHDLAGDPRVVALLRRLRRFPQHRTV
jgi:hypothetical protein